MPVRLEANYVLLLGLEKGNFPSAKENDELIDLLLPEQEPYLFAEERRLFYVAVTRARHYVFMIFDSQNTSAFVEEIARMGHQLITKSDSLEIGQWSCPDCESGNLTGKVSRYDKNSMSVRTLLPVIIRPAPASNVALRW